MIFRYVKLYFVNYWLFRYLIYTAIYVGLYILFFHLHKNSRDIKYILRVEYIFFFKIKYVRAILNLKCTYVSSKDKVVCSLLTSISMKHCLPQYQNISQIFLLINMDT